MEAPDKIYLLKVELEERWPGITEASELEPQEEECYIRKDALLEWIEEYRNTLSEFLEKKHSPVTAGKMYVLIKLLDKLNSM